MDHLAYPHIMDAIIAAAPYDSLISLRATSSDMRARIDPLLAQRMTVHLPNSTVHEMDGPLHVTYGASVPLSRYPSALPNRNPNPACEVHSTQLKPYADVLAMARIVDLRGPANHYRLWQMYPFLSGVHTVRYRGPDLYASAYAETTVSVRHIVDQFLISLRATRIIVSLDADSPPQVRQIAYPVLRLARKAVINMWWSPERPHMSAAHRCNLVLDMGIKDLVFLCRRKTASPTSNVPRKPPTRQPIPQKTGMFRNMLKYGVGRILSPDWTKVLTFVGLETVAPAALGYTDTEPSLAQIIDDMFGFIIAEGIGCELPDDYGTALALLQDCVRFLTHGEYSAEIGREEYEIEMMPPPT
ncbi:hypothetical protein CspHIS471_0702640 [Cutaneotrichosporon sp. HIS471]|nr:hypothetical protein CspHIS471_0702640 [Cutaneotrichosporon sp. HIS471]